MTKRIEIGRTVTPTSSPPIVEPEAKAPVRVEARIIPQANIVMDDAQAILALELRYLRRAVEEEQRPLTQAEAIKYASHVRSLTALSDEQRKRDASNDWSQLGDEQLLRLVIDALGSTAAGKATAIEALRALTGGKAS